MANDKPFTDPAPRLRWSMSGMRSMLVAALAALAVMGPMPMAPMPVVKQRPRAKAPKHTKAAQKKARKIMRRNAR